MGRRWITRKGNLKGILNYCNVGTIEIYLVGEIKQHGHGQEKYWLVLIITII